MARSKRSVEIPDDIAEALEAFAYANGKTEGEIIVEVLQQVLGNRLFKPYIKDGVFDKERFRADLRLTGEQLGQWRRDHPDEMADLRKAGSAV